MFEVCDILKEMGCEDVILVVLEFYMIGLRDMFYVIFVCVVFVFLMMFGIGWKFVKVGFDGEKKKVGDIVVVVV